MIKPEGTNLWLGESKLKTLDGPLIVSKFEEKPKLLESKIVREKESERKVRGPYNKSKIKADLKLKGGERVFIQNIALTPAESREEDPKKKVGRPNKCSKCEKCEQSFISNNALRRHTNSIHTAGSKASVEKNKSETVGNEEEAKKTVATEACRYCKSFFNLDDNPFEIGLALCPARRNQQLDCKMDIGFDADTYFEAFYKESMGDYLFFAEEVDPLSKEDVEVLKGNERNALSPPLCSECSDDFYWPLDRNQVFSFLHQIYFIMLPSRVWQDNIQRH